MQNLEAGTKKRNWGLIEGKDLFGEAMRQLPPTNLRKNIPLKYHATGFNV